ncbi:MAG TPA: hypothetical protein VJ804_09090, partial [Acidimicrobiales bacterium]|nr:hypothetical protein [Acidimicrobiales bacterium]
MIDISHRRRQRSPRGTAVVVAMALLVLVAACGQKPGVHDASQDEGSGSAVQAGSGSASDG